MNDVLLKVDGELYSDEYMDIDNTARRVLNVIFKLMGTDSNVVRLGRTVMGNMMNDTGYTENTIRKSLVRLNSGHLAEMTNNRGEYIVNPLLAIKGDEDSVWREYSRVEDRKRTLRSTRIYND